jgi:hypothetical protein
MQTRFIQSLIVYLLSFAAISAPTVVEHPGMRYDPATQTYRMKFPANAERKSALPDVLWSSKTLIDPNLQVELSGRLDGSLRYRYVVGSGSTSRQAIALFWLSPIAAIDGVDVLPGKALGEMPPMGLPELFEGNASERKAKAKRGGEIFRAATKKLDEQAQAAIVPPFRWRQIVSHLPQHGGPKVSFMATRDAYREYLLRPGERLQFEFSSTAIPGLIQVPFEGEVPVLLLPSEADRTDDQTDAYLKWMREDRLLVTTIAPSILRPAEWRVSTIGALMQRELKQWPAKKLTSLETADRLVSALLGIVEARLRRESVVDAERNLDNLLAALPDVSQPMRQLLGIYAKQVSQAPL